MFAILVISESERTCFFYLRLTCYHRLENTDRKCMSRTLSWYNFRYRSKLASERSVNGPYKFDLGYLIASGKSCGTRSSPGHGTYVVLTRSLKYSRDVRISDVFLDSIHSTTIFMSLPEAKSSLVAHPRAPAAASNCCRASLGLSVIL